MSSTGNQKTRDKFTTELLRAMAAKKISRTELAHRLGVSIQAVSKQLKLGTQWQIDTMERYANAVGISVDVNVKIGS